MKEKDFQREFGKWVQNNNTYIGGSAVFELKIMKGTSIRWDAVKDHQVSALHDAKHSRIYHKITDMPHFKGMMTRFDAKKPFDCFIIHRALAYIVIWNYVKGTRELHREMVWIDIDAWVRAREESNKKSANWNELKMIGEVLHF